MQDRFNAFRTFHINTIMVWLLLYLSSFTWHTMFFFKLYLPYFMRMSFLPACMSASRMCMVSQKVRWQSWNWELKTAVSCYMSSGNRTWVRCKNSKCFQQLSHLSRFGIVSLRLTDFVANVSSMATVYYMVTSHFRFFTIRWSLGLFPRWIYD